MVVQRGFLSIRVQTLITQAWNGAIDIDNPLALLGGFLLFGEIIWYVANTIDSLNASIPSNC